MDKNLITEESEQPLLLPLLTTQVVEMPVNRKKWDCDYLISSSILECLEKNINLVHISGDTSEILPYALKSFKSLEAKDRYYFDCLQFNVETKNRKKQDGVTYFKTPQEVLDAVDEAIANPVARITIIIVPSYIKAMHEGYKLPVPRDYDFKPKTHSKPTLTLVENNDVKAA